MKDPKLMDNNILFVDKFEENTPLGKAVGRTVNKQIVRGGIDVEGVIGVDNGALRIQPLLNPGWGRAGIAYGPFKRECGLAFGLHVLNGHNTAQTGHLLQSLPGRFKRWILGSSSENPLSNLLKMVVQGNKHRQWRQVRRWIQANYHHRKADNNTLDENFSAGWFSESRPIKPTDKSNAFIVHATGPENGELWANFNGQPLRIVRGIQNIPFYYIVILREKGAAYYAASLPDAFGVDSYPNMRILAIEPFSEDQELYAAAWQSVMGQIGFWVDTRIYGAGVARLPSYSQWYGSAIGADRLRGSGDLDCSLDELGGQWKVVQGRIVRTHQGVRSEARESMAILDLSSPIGLLHILFQGGKDCNAGFVWRWRDKKNYWQVTVGKDGSRLYCCEEGALAEIAIDFNHTLEDGRCHSLQLVENQKTIAAYLDGKLLFDQWFSDERLAGKGQAGIVFYGEQPQTLIEAFEAHPAVLPIPKALDFGPSWVPDFGKDPIVRDDFSGEAVDLSGRITTEGDYTWTRTMGSGRFVLSGDNRLEVDATVSDPNPDRTAYTIPWHEPDFADVRVCILPPGQGRGEWQRGRGGIIFWQDNQNYIIVNTWLDDFYEGASLSSFFYLNGYEDIYDAVWTNVGKRIVWGQLYNLRVTFNGLNYLVHLDNEPVLYRSLTDIYPDCRPLSINRVGLVANWEWGHDTGTKFSNFCVYGKEREK